MTTQDRILELKQSGMSLTKIAREVQSDFPGLDLLVVVRKVRNTLERAGMTAKGAPVAQEKPQELPDRSSIEYKADGSIISEKFITLKNGQEMTPDFILGAHGLKPSLWEVVAYRNNFWNSQLKGGTLQINYQSRLTAKPRINGVDVDMVIERFKELDREAFTPPTHKPVEGSMMAEVNIADLHLGKLCWHGDTLGNYDHKIAEELFYRIVGEIVEQLHGKPIEQILFVWANDFFNSDNEQKTTTAGTPQDTDVRNKKMFNTGWEMLIRAIEMLKEIAPVKTFYTPSNHDEETAYHALGVLRAWFRNEPRVTVDLDAYPRKYILYGNTLLGFTHGDKENDKGSKEKASRLASLMPIEAREMWGKSRYREMHAAHLHSEQMIAEINGVIVRRVSSPTALDTWHTTNGFMGAVRKAQTFIYDRECGLMQIIHTPVR